MSTKAWIWIIMGTAIAILVGAFYFVFTTPAPTQSTIKTPEPAPIGGERDEHGCLGPAGYAYDEEVGACTRAWELTPDIRDAARRAVEFVGKGETLTVVAFNSFEEPGAYDIMLERGLERVRQTVSLRGDGWEVLECRESDAYLAIEKSKAFSDRPGANVSILLKKKAGDAPMPCLFDIADGDIEISEDGPTYLLDMVGSYLILDHGTAPPPRGLSVYDIAAKHVIYEDHYNRPIAKGEGTFTYWQPIDTPATAENCPEMATWQVQGLGAGIEREVTLTLSDLTLAPSGAQRCTARQ